MAWITIAEASNVEELKGLIPSITELPKGTKVRIEVEMWGVGPLFDSPLGNITGYLTPTGFIFKDAFGEGWSTGVIEGESDPIQVVALLWAVAALLTALGVSIALIRIRVDKLPEVLKPLTELPKAIAEIPLYISETFKGLGEAIGSVGETVKAAAEGTSTLLASVKSLAPWLIAAFIIYEVAGREKRKAVRKEGA